MTRELESGKKMGVGHLGCLRTAAAHGMATDILGLVTFLLIPKQFRLGIVEQVRDTIDRIKRKTTKHTAPSPSKTHPSPPLHPSPPPKSLQSAWQLPQQAQPRSPSYYAAPNYSPRTPD
jgi:hypothetical protein